MLVPEAAPAETPHPGRAGQSRFAGSWAVRHLHRLRRDPVTILGLALVVLVLLVTAVGPRMTPYNPYRLNPMMALAKPSRAHPLGTDELGRDILTRVLHGARLSLTSGITTVVMAAMVGTLLGSISGIARGMVDDLIMRAADVFLAFPPLILAMAVVAALGPGLNQAMAAVAFVWWPGYARLMRGQVLTTMPRVFIEAAYAIGASRARILFRHVVPNCITPILVKGSIDIGHAILLTSSLGFVGLGAPLPTPEWGTMIATARLYLLDQWWYATSVGFAIFVSVLAFSLLGDGLRDLLDPRRHYAQ